MVIEIPTGTPLENQVAALPKRVLQLSDHFPARGAEAHLYPFASQAKDLTQNNQLFLVIPGLAQHPIEDPLLEIAHTIALNFGECNILHAPVVVSPQASPYWFTVKGQSLPISDAISTYLRQHQYSSITIIGHSLGGTRAIAAMNLAQAHQLPIKQIICLGSPDTLVAADIPYINSKTTSSGIGMMGIALESIGSRGVLRTISTQETYEEAAVKSEALIRGGLDILQSIGTTVYNISLNHDGVVPETSLLAGPSVAKVTSHLTEDKHPDLNPSDVHNWRGVYRNILKDVLLSTIRSAGN